MSWAKFFNMGGYAFYVWGSFGVALLSMAVEVLLLRRRKRALLRQAKQAHKIKQTMDDEQWTMGNTL